MSETKFTPDEVENLAFNQQTNLFHPFTCPNRGDGNHRDAYGDLGALVATVRGWVCPFCDYTQDWAHGFQKESKLVRGPFPTVEQITEGANMMLAQHPARYTAGDPDEGSD